jgi:hypothetical protein
MRSTQPTIDVKPDRSKESAWCRWIFFEQPFPTHATAAIWRYEPTTTRRRYHPHAGHKANSIPQTSHVRRIWVTHSDLVQHIVWWRHLSMDHSACLLQGPSPFWLQPWQAHRLVYCSCSPCTLCTKGLPPEETAKDRAKNRANATDETISAACCSESDDCGPSHYILNQSLPFSIAGLTSSHERAHEAPNDVTHNAPSRYQQSSSQPHVSVRLSDMSPCEIAGLL